MSLEDENDRLVQEWACKQKSYLSWQRAECGHHYYSRRHMLLRWDTANIIPLTFKQHQNVHEGNITIEIKNPFRKQYLDNMVNKDFKEYLLESGMTLKDFVKYCNLELRRKISEI